MRKANRKSINNISHVQKMAEGLARVLWLLKFNRLPYINICMYADKNNINLIGATYICAPKLSSLVLNVG